MAGLAGCLAGWLVLARGGRACVGFRNLGICPVHILHVSVVVLRPGYCRVNPVMGSGGESFEVRARGELQLGLLIGECS